MKSDSGVVTRMCGGRRSIAVRSLAGVSPVRRPARIGASVEAQLDRDRAHAVERLLEIEADIVGERLQRRNVQDRDFVAQSAAVGLVTYEAIDRPHEGGQGLAAAGRRAEQNVVAGRDLRLAMSGHPSSCAREGASKRRSNQVADGRMESVENAEIT